MFFVIIFIKQPKFVEEGVRRERERRGKEERKEGRKQNIFYFKYRQR